MPHGNVDPDASRTALGRGLQVCGPLRFAGDKEDAGERALSVELLVVIVSDARHGVPFGVAVPGLVFYDDGTPDQEWMTAVPHLPPGVFQVGPARVTVFALVTLVSGGKVRERWSEPVNIT